MLTKAVRNVPVTESASPFRSKLIFDTPVTIANLPGVRRIDPCGMNVLKTPAGKAFRPQDDRHIYLVWIAWVWAWTLIGFVPDLSRYMAETPPPPFVLHLHGFVYSLWLVCVTAQIALVEVGKPALHRSLGWWLVGLSALLVPLGLTATMVDMARSAAHTPYQPEFLGLEFQSMLVFAILLWLAVRMRRDLAAHKRLMILLTLCFIDPGGSRAFSLFSPVQPGGAFGWWLHYFWANAAMLVAMMGWDVWRHGRVHPALLGGGAILATGEAAAVALEFLPWWHGVAGSIVAAWGWTG